MSTQNIRHFFINIYLMQNNYNLKGMILYKYYLQKKNYYHTRLCIFYSWDFHIYYLSQYLCNFDSTNLQIHIGNY